MIDAPSSGSGISSIWRVSRSGDPGPGPIRPKGRQTVPPRDAIQLGLPGGGGFGDPKKRDPQRVLDDVLDGLITAEEARRDYGVVIDARGEIDLAETARVRSP